MLCEKRNEKMTVGNARVVSVVWNFLSEVIIVMPIYNITTPLFITLAFQVEAMAQLCGIIALQQPISDGRGTFFFGGVNGVKWKKPVTPGDVLVMEVSNTTGTDL